MIYTKKTIYFLKANTDHVMDLVPMDEVVNIQDADTNVNLSQCSMNDISLHVSDETSPKSAESTVKIETLQNGFNSGRVYHLQVSLHRLICFLRLCRELQQ